MILTLIINNPINNQKEELIIKYPNVDYFYFKRIINYNNDDDIINILNVILKNLDCTIEYKCGRIRMTNYPIYSMTLSEYYFYLIKLNNQFTYNKYIDKLIQRHIDNIVFEYEHPYVTSNNKKKSVNKKKLPPNKFFKQVTRDLFTNEEKYIYINPRTNEEIISNNPNMLEQLNSSKRKNHNKTKKIGVPISSMTFSFKKK